jgi:hypothetical protein
MNQDPHCNYVSESIGFRIFGGYFVLYKSSKVRAVFVLFTPFILKLISLQNYVNQTFWYQLPAVEYTIKITHFLTRPD